MDQSADTSAENDELTRIRDWMAENQAAYNVHCFFRDTDPLGRIKEAVFATSNTGDAPKVAGKPLLAATRY